MSRRRKRPRWHDWDEPDEQRRRPGWVDAEDARPGRRPKRRHFSGESDRVAAMAERKDLAPAALTCHQCAHLLVTRSLVKAVDQSWEQAIAYPTFSCFEQRWTLEDPDSVPDHAAIVPYLVGDAAQCPSFARGQPRDHRW